MIPSLCNDTLIIDVGTEANVTITSHNQERLDHEQVDCYGMDHEQVDCYGMDHEQVDCIWYGSRIG